MRMNERLRPGARVCRRAYVADFRIKFPVAALKFSDLRNIFPVNLHRQLFEVAVGQRFLGQEPSPDATKP